MISVSSPRIGPRRHPTSGGGANFTDSVLFASVAPGAATLSNADFVLI